MPKEVKDSELSKKAYAEKYNVPLETVNLRIREGRVMWRYLFPETKEYVLIDTEYKAIVQKEVKKEVLFVKNDN